MSNKEAFYWEGCQSITGNSHAYKLADTEGKSVVHLHGGNVTGKPKHFKSGNINIGIASRQSKAGFEPTTQKLDGASVHHYWDCCF